MTSTPTVTGKVRQPAYVTVGEFYERHREKLRLRLLGSDVGFARRISEPTVNRPGLALAGFYEYFAKKRIQVIGFQEFSYIQSLPVAAQRQRFGELCNHELPCLIMCRRLDLPKSLLTIANNAGISVFQTSTTTMRFLNAATIALEIDFAPSVSDHASMVDVKGMGILLRGSSGAGKSETVLGLLERGHCLIADDLVHLRAVEGREIVASAPAHNRYHMEVRGLGIINVASLYGIGAIRPEKRVDLVVQLVSPKSMNDVERVGTERKTINILGISIPLVELPVAAGRDMAQLVEVAALDQKLKNLGHNSALEFSKNLLNLMQNREASLRPL